jgi:hypothetical protein
LRPPFGPRADKVPGASTRAPQARHNAQGRENAVNATLRRTAFVTLSAIAMGAPTASHAQDKPYTEGSVWTVSMIRVKPGMFDVYMKELLPMRKKVTEEARKQGLVLSSHILAGAANGRDDFDVMILEEYRNWAAFDGLSTKYDAIMRNVVGPEDKQVQVMTKRTEVRDILGDKVMQEIVTK